MPKQVTGVQVTDNGDGSATIQVGPWGFTRPKSDLFDRSSPSPELVRNNVRLAFLIGNYTEPASVEFLTAVNKSGQGLEGSDGKYIIKSVADTDGSGQRFHLEFTNRRGETFGFEMDRAELAADWADAQIVLLNLVPFLRVAGYSDLTAQAIAAVKNASFWY